MNNLHLPNGRDEELHRKILQEAWDYVKWSNCLDKQLAASLVKDGMIIGQGCNLCAPPPYDYSDVLPVCPRKNAKRGTQRKACYGFHAEVFACLSATRGGITPKDYARFAWYQFGGEAWYKFWGEIRGIRTWRALKRRFSQEDRDRLCGAELYLVGVAHVCPVCQELLDWLGIVVHEDNIIPRPPDVADFEHRRTFDQ